MDLTENELYQSCSPYLLQHKDNPVAWKMWGPKAFEEARRRNVPILISVGYSTCHWCHVMAHEVFEIESISKFMNENMVCIKVDREESPEVDELYMEACQILNGSGGWPLNVFTDLNGKPFYAATYVPARNWIELIQKICNAWKSEPNLIQDHANKMVAYMESHNMPEVNTGSVDLSSLLFDQLRARFDRINPDFFSMPNAPRFPSHTLFDYLLSKKSLPSDIHHMLEEVLSTLQDSGIHDRVGGGFHRYATEETWRIPHFEKMLYDNAQLMATFAMASVTCQRKDFLQTAERIATYIMRDLSVYRQEIFLGYACAEDADDPEGEGSFYSWTRGQLMTLIGEVQGNQLADYWNISNDSQMVHDIYPGRIPHPRGSSLFNSLSLSEKINKRLEWEEICNFLLNQRNKRPRPFRDTKILTDWNALTLYGFSILYANTLNPIYLQEVKKIASILVDRIHENNIERLPGKEGHLSDYGHSALAFYTAWEVTGDKTYLNISEKLTVCALEKFSMPSGNLFTSGKNNSLFMRHQEKMDHPYPAGAHSLLKAWTRLSAHGLLFDYTMLVQKIIQNRIQLARQEPSMVLCLLQVLDETNNGPITLSLPINFRETHSTLLAWAGTEVRLKTEFKEDLFQVCEKDRCLLPVYSETELLKHLSR